MRSVIHMRLAFGLLTIGSAVASPCKPLSATTTTAATSVASTETSLVTSIASTTEDISATSSAVVESSVETSVSSAETSASSTEALDSSITIETSATSATTDFTTDLTTTAAETTSIPTFTMFASGSNAVAGISLQSYSRDNAVVVFDPATDDDSPSARPYSIDSQGRLVNDLGWFLCGSYGVTNDELDKPATVATCHSKSPLETAFLTCELAGFEVQCSVPAISCVSTGFPFMPASCVASTGTWSVSSVGMRSVGHTWQIGSSDTPANYERMTMSIREV